MLPPWKITITINIKKKAIVINNFFIQDDSPLTLSIGENKFLEKSQKINEPPHGLHHMSFMIVYKSKSYISA